MHWKQDLGNTVSWLAQNTTFPCARCVSMKKAAFVIGVEAQRKKTRSRINDFSIDGKDYTEGSETVCCSVSWNRDNFRSAIDSLSVAIRTYSMCVDVAAILWLKD